MVGWCKLNETATREPPHSGAAPAFRTVAPVLAVCAAFAAQPSAYPLEAPKPDVAPPCGHFGGSGKHRPNTSRKQPLRPEHSKWQNRTILDAAAERQDKAKGSCVPLGRHNFPQCGQFGAFGQGLLRGQKQSHWGQKNKKPRCFKENSGVMH